MAITATLKVSVDELKTISSQFAEKASEVKMLTGNMLTLIDNTKSVWHGEANTGYVKKFDSLRGDMDRFYRKVDEYHTDLQEISQVYSSAETGNKELGNALQTDVIK